MIEIVKRPEIINLVKRVYKQKNYVFFDDNKPFNVNLIGVRKDVNAKVDTFDDAFLLIYRNESKTIRIHTFECTTEPSLHYLQNPINTDKGTMIMFPDQYRGSHKLGLHQKKYLALVQQKPIKVYRDNNRDTAIDFDADSIETGYFGANIHRASEYKDLETIGLYSAGCQVLRKNEDFNLLIEVCEISSDMYGNSFTYTLINETDLLGV